MNIWDVLEIEATSSARAIKRAYARQLTKHHPEDDPKGFQLVQAAYERALLIRSTWTSTAQTRLRRTFFVHT